MRQKPEVEMANSAAVKRQWSKFAQSGLATSEVVCNVPLRQRERARFTTYFSLKVVCSTDFEGRRSEFRKSRISGVVYSVK